MKKLFIIILFFVLCLSASAQLKMFGQMLNLGHWSTDGLVFYWRGIEAGEVVDESFYGNHGTITGATWVGQGLNFDGSDSAPTVEEIRTELEEDGSKLDHLWEMTADDAGVRRLTTNALELGPVGEGLTASDMYTDITKIPWQEVYHEIGNTSNEYYRENLYTANGIPIISTDLKIGKRVRD